MYRFITLFLLSLAISPAWAADMANGQMINKSCALCHGIYGQGASGKLSPRIAGLPKEYIIKAMKDYVEGKRVYPLMVRTSQIDRFTEKDYDDIATYLSSLDLSSDRRFNIIARYGNPDIIFISGWNDWQYANQIEPAVEYGFQYVDIAARLLGRGPETAPYRD